MHASVCGVFTITGDIFPSEERKSEPSTGSRCCYGNIYVLLVRLHRVRPDWLTCFRNEDSSRTSRASCDVEGGAWSIDEEMCEMIVFVYLKDANHPDPLRARMG